MKIKKKILLSSKLNSKKKSTEKIIDICKMLKTKNYLSTSGSKIYLERDTEIIKKSKINIFFHNYNHPTYNQCFNSFNKYASIIDLLFNEGPNAYSILKSGGNKYSKLKV